MDYNSKEYQKYVLDYTVKQIQKRFSIKTKKEAEAFFFKAIAYNTVQEEILDKIDYLINEKQ